MKEHDLKTYIRTHVLDGITLYRVDGKWELWVEYEEGRGVCERLQLTKSREPRLFASLESARRFIRNAGWSYSIAIDEMFIQRVSDVDNGHG